MHNLNLQHQSNEGKSVSTDQKLCNP